MNCIEYKKYYAKYTNYPIPNPAEPEPKSFANVMGFQNIGTKEVWETEHYELWQDHIHSCTKCSDWSLRQQVLQWGGDVDDWPCVHMAYHVIFRCEEHTELSECSKAIILYFEKFDEYCIGPRGGRGDLYQINYCPICGIKLPESKRDFYFERLEEMGLEYCDDRIPNEYNSSEWYKKTVQQL